MNADAAVVSRTSRASISRAPTISVNNNTSSTTTTTAQTTTATATVEPEPVVEDTVDDTIDEVEYVEEYVEEEYDDEPIVVENKSLQFSSSLGDAMSSGSGSSDTALADMVRAQRAALDAAGNTVATKRSANTSNACDADLRACMTDKCGKNFSKCASDTDTMFGTKLDSCRRNTKCDADEYRVFTAEIKADRVSAIKLQSFNDIIDCGKNYDACIVNQCGATYSKCLGKSAGDAAISKCGSIAKQCNAMDSGLASRTMSVFGTLRQTAEKQISTDEKKLYTMRDQMRSTCARLGAMLDDRSLDCVYTVNFLAGGDSTLYSSKKAYAGNTFDCTPAWFGVDITTYMENAYRATREQSAASGAMLGSGVGMAVGALTSGAIGRAIETQKADKELCEAQAGMKWSSFRNECVEDDSEEKAAKKEERQERREERQEARQEKREERKEARQEKREERQEERQEKREERKEARQEKRDERQEARQEKREERQEARAVASAQKAEEKAAKEEAKQQEKANARTNCTTQELKNLGYEHAVKGTVKQQDKSGNVTKCDITECEYGYELAKLTNKCKESNNVKKEEKQEAKAVASAQKAEEKAAVQTQKANDKAAKEQEKDLQKREQNCVYEGAKGTWQGDDNDGKCLCDSAEGKVVNADGICVFKGLTVKESANRIDFIKNCKASGGNPLNNGAKCSCPNNMNADKNGNCPGERAIERAEKREEKSAARAATATQKAEDKAAKEQEKQEQQKLKRQQELCDKDPWGKWSTVPEPICRCGDDRYWTGERCRPNDIQNQRYENCETSNGHVVNKGHTDEHCSCYGTAKPDTDWFCPSIEEIQARQNANEQELCEKDPDGRWYSAPEPGCRCLSRKQWIDYKCQTPAQTIYDLKVEMYANKSSNEPDNRWFATASRFLFDKYCQGEYENTLSCNTQELKCKTFNGTDRSHIQQEIKVACFTTYQNRNVLSDGKIVITAKRP